MPQPLANSINRLLKDHGSPMAGYGEQIVAASRKYYKKDPGLLARYIVGIAGSESTFGTNPNSDVARGYKNAWGLFHPPSGLMEQGKFRTWDEGISGAAKWLGSYLDHGLTRADQIQRRWVKGDDWAVAAQGGGFGSWYDTVTSTMKQLGGTVPPGAPPSATAAALPVPPSTPAPVLPAPAPVAAVAPPRQGLDLTQFALGQLGEMAQGWEYNPMRSLSQLAQQIAMQPRPEMPVAPAPAVPTAPTVTPPPSTTAVPPSSTTAPKTSGSPLVFNGKYKVVPPEWGHASGAAEPGKRVLTFVDYLAKAAHRNITPWDTTGHSQMTTNNTVSAHWSGQALDLPATGSELIRLGRLALILAGEDPAWANKQTLGLFNTKAGYQVIFGTNDPNLGGDHRDHVHVGVSRATGDIPPGVKRK